MRGTDREGNATLPQFCWACKGNGAILIATQTFEWTLRWCKQLYSSPVVLVVFSMTLHFARPYLRFHGWLVCPPDFDSTDLQPHLEYEAPEGSKLRYDTGAAKTSFLTQFMSNGSLLLTSGTAPDTDRPTITSRDTAPSSAATSIAWGRKTTNQFAPLQSQPVASKPVLLAASA